MGEKRKDSCCRAVPAIPVSSDPAAIRGTFWKAMGRRALLLLCAVLLGAKVVQGLSTNGGGRCLYPGPGSDSVERKLVKKIDSYPRSPDCDNVEVIATMKKTGELKCLNWSAKKVVLMRSLVKEKKKTALRNAHKKFKARVFHG
ncbi:C-X-C motif chemokine 10-like [Ambystoma mexicanum]|uniref:C-X-C motif chemokine 10-like n=1 Tax=Ambystoma mexicanum TaxID=8296 RepID=UPI0037E78C2A